MSSKGAGTANASAAPSRARQFYGGITFTPDASQTKRGVDFLIVHQYNKDAKRSVGKERRQSKFSRERRAIKHKDFSCFENVVESLETVKGVWRCVYCHLDVEIDNKTNQVRCPQCQAKHLEAPRRPTQGLLPAR